MSIRARLLLIALLATAIPALLVLANFIKDREAAIAGDARRLAELAQAKAEDLHQRIRGTAQLQFAASASRREASSAPASSAADSMTRMPRPPPPQLALSITGKPMPSADSPAWR